MDEGILLFGFHINEYIFSAKFVFADYADSSILYLPSFSLVDITERDILVNTSSDLQDTLFVGIKFKMS